MGTNNQIESNVFYFPSLNSGICAEKDSIVFYFRHHKQWLQPRPHPQDEILVTSLHDLLYFMWLLTSCPEAMADIRDSSPAKTAPATMVAKSLEFDPGSSLLAPFTPSMFKQADWDASCVPPPTVPTWEVKKTYKT